MKKIILMIAILSLFTTFYVQAQEEDWNQATETEKKIREIELSNMSEDEKEKLINQMGGSQEESENELTQTNCTDYYKFQSVQVSLGANLDSYVPGDTIELRGELINQNTYPIVDGNVFARVSKKNPNYVTEGNYIIDELILEEKVALKENEVREVNYQWDIPSALAKGDYRIDYFFSVGKKFNLGGLPFSNEVIIGSTEFNIDSDNTEYISFKRDRTTVNNEPYRHIGNWPNIEPGQQVIINQPIVNTYKDIKELNVAYNLYHWDSLNQADLKDTKIEAITLNPKETKDLVYTIEKMDNAVYYLQIIASSGQDKSIVNIRITSPQQNIRLNYPAITKFPISKGDNFTLFSCFHNGSGIDTKGRVDVKLTDKNDKEIGSFQYQGNITSEMLAEKAEVTAKDDYNYLKLTAKTYDENNNLTDEYEIVYDCNDYNNCKIQKQNQLLSPIKDSAKALMIIFIVIIIGVVATVAIRGIKKK